MRKPAAGALSAILCAALVAACGDAGSTTTTTLPSGKLGAASYCVVPADLRSGLKINVIGIRPIGVDCGQAVAIATIYASSQRDPLKYRCPVTRSARGGQAMCLNDEGTGVQITWTDGA